MHLPDSFQIGEHAFTIDGPSGLLEGIYFAQTQPKGAAIICHPHPLHEGTMHNKVVHMVSRAFNQQGITTIRFNYRGVGKSEGFYGDSDGEIEDLLSIFAWLDQIMPKTHLYLAGFSFGAFIAASAAVKINCKQLFTICPAVTNQRYDLLGNITCPWVVIQSTQDEVIPPEQVYQWFENRRKIQPNGMMLIQVDASHFFHGKLTALKDIIVNNV